MFCQTAVHQSTSKTVNIVTDVTTADVAVADVVAAADVATTDPVIDVTVAKTVTSIHLPKCNKPYLTLNLS